MADHFARAAGFAGDETTEASIMPGGAAARRAFDSTMDSETQGFTGIVQPPNQRILPPLREEDNADEKPSENRPSPRLSNAVNGAGKMGSIRVPPSRAPLQSAHHANGGANGGGTSSRPSSSQGPRKSKDIVSNPAMMFTAVQQDISIPDDEGDSSDEMIADRPNATVANETTVASADVSEWERHIKEAQNKAGVGAKQMQQRIDSLLQERDDLKIEVDMLRRQYNPDERASELIRLRKENIHVTSHRLTLSNLLTDQKKLIKSLQKQAKEMSKQQEGAGSKELRKRLEEMEEAVKLLDQQNKEEKAAREKAEREAEQRRSQLADMETERNELADELDQVRADKDDLDQEMFKIENQRDEADEDRAQWKQKAAEHEEKVAEYKRRIGALEQEAEQRVEHSLAQHDEQHQRELERIVAALDAKVDELERTQTELQDVRSQLEATAREVEVFKVQAESQRAAEEEKFNELRDELSAKANELMELEEVHEELLGYRKADEEELADLGARFDDLQKLLEDKENELIECNREVAAQADVIRQLEEEHDLSVADANEAVQGRAQVEEDLQAQKDHYEMKIEGFKSKLADAAAELAEAHQRVQVAEEDSHALRSKLDAYREKMRTRNEELDAALSTNAKLDGKVQDLLADLKDEERNREMEGAEWEKKLGDIEDDLRRIIDEKDDALDSLEADLDSARQSLKDRDADLDALQQALQAKESESNQLGRTSATDRHSLQLEIDRLKRDLSRCESDLQKAREDLDRKDEAIREKTSQMNKMYSENCEYSAKLATETQTRLGLDERLAALKNSLRETENALELARARIEQLEKQRTDEDTSMERNEGAAKRQVMERNQLLVTVSQHMLKILGGDDVGVTASPRKRDAEPKPSTDFGAFHQVLIGRLRKLAEIKAGFEKRAARMQGNFTDSFNTLRRQQESRFRQIDRLETSLKSAADKQHQWRSRVVAKQAELDAAKGTVSELQSQISSLKTRSSLASPADNSKLTSLTSRANAAEKRLSIAQNQASAAEERLAEAKSKYNDGESKWLARIKELEARCKAAEEKVKRERQGAKERVAEQQEQRRKLEAEVAAAQRRLKTVDHLQAGLEGVQ